MAYFQRKKCNICFAQKEKKKQKKSTQNLFLSFFCERRKNHFTKNLDGRTFLLFWQL